MAFATPFVVGGRKVLWPDLVLTLQTTAWEGASAFIEANRSRIHQDPAIARLDRSERAPTEERPLSFTIVMSFCHPPGQSRSQFTIGRDPKCDIVFTNGSVSNHHIKFGVEGDHIVLYDVSLNGSELTLDDRGPQWTNPAPGIPYKCILPAACKIMLRLGENLPSFQINVPHRKGAQVQEFRKRRDTFLANCSDLGALNMASQVPTLAATPSHPARGKKRQHLYWFESTLGRGGCGIVYRVRRLQDWGVFAAKQVLEHKPQSSSRSRSGTDSEAEREQFEAERRKREAEIRRLKKEMKVLQPLKHERIVEYVDWYEDRTNTWILVMEYCQYGSLDQMIGRTKTPFKAHEIAEILKQTAEGLLYLHGEGITHRDLKPGNILVRSRSPLALALGDFGLAKNTTDSESRMNTFCGTVPYMAPEMWEGRYAKAIDIWALGVVGFVLLNNGLSGLGKCRPNEYAGAIFEKSAAMHEKDPKDRLVANVSKMLAWDPRDRPPAAECIEDANDVLNPLRPTQTILPVPSLTFPPTQAQARGGEPTIQPSSAPNDRTLRSSEIRSYEKHFQTTGWRAAHADAAATIVPGQHTAQKKGTDARSRSNSPATARWVPPTQKRGTDALPRSNSAEAPASKIPRTGEQRSQQRKATDARSQPNNPSGAVGQRPPHKSETDAPPQGSSPATAARQPPPQRRASGTLPQPNSASAPRQQPVQNTGTTNPSSRSNPPSAATREALSTERPTRKTPPPRAGEKEPRPPQRKDTGDSTLPRTNSLPASRQNPTETRATNVAPKPNSGAETAQKIPRVDDDAKKA
ncbi:kinase-like domain-containing protein [Chaetomidium leptoderma]|uniref:Kinase-like domain-containing protein n=1 Tax=Chaetomidium leptoderma TaxID=669021 RepID=A0AAN7A0A0_9PEZI|nr:kinase-like domain-containing protein [Chaetomidium leptoderma]